MGYTRHLPTPRDEISLDILDTGVRLSSETIEKHTKWGDGYILFYSLTDRESLTYLSEVKDIITKDKCRDCPLTLVGNKSDLIYAREVNDEESCDFGQKFDCPKFEISTAETSQGVLEVMDENMCQIKRDFVKNMNTSNQLAIADNKPRSQLNSMKKAFKKRINRSHNDTF
ncbi:ras-related and estrogen-regulated growth inhibitor-like [Mya arenaria]|nr:ras-related and estrogen-regulated growth inhibitor-like [Mya arenaria]